MYEKKDREDEQQDKNTIWMNSEKYSSAVTSCTPPKVGRLFLSINA